MYHTSTNVLHIIYAAHKTLYACICAVYKSVCVVHLNIMECEQVCVVCHILSSAIYVFTHV